MATGRTPALGWGRAVWSGEGVAPGPQGGAEGLVLCWVLGGAADTGLTPGRGRALCRCPPLDAVHSRRWDVVLGYDVPVSEKQAQRVEVTHPKHPAGDGEKQLGARPCTLGGELGEGGIAKVQSDLWSSGLGWAGTAVTAISSRSDRSREHSCVRLWQSGRSGLVPVALVSALAAFSRPTPFVGTRQDPRAPPSLAKGLRLQLQPQVWLVGREGVTSPPSPAPP